MRKPTGKEKSYIKEMCNTESVFGMYVLNFFIIATFVLSICICVALGIASEESSRMGEALQKMKSMFLLTSVVLLFLLVRSCIVIRKKTAVRHGRYDVTEGMAVQYEPYKMPRVGSYITNSGRKVTGANNPIIDGRIMFTSNTGEKETDWIDLKYRSCPKGDDLGAFPVLRITMQNGTKFAVTDWDKIEKNAAYAHIKPFMVRK